MVLKIDLKHDLDFSSDLTPIDLLLKMKKKLKVCFLFALLFQICKTPFAKTDSITDPMTDSTTDPDWTHP